MTESQELSDELDLVYWFQREGLPHKMGRGSGGMQINTKSCPNPDCGDNRWRVYINPDTGLGNCFVCSTGFTKLSFINHYLGGNWRQTFEHVKEVLKEQGWRPKRTTTAAVEHGEIKLPTSYELPTPEGQNLIYLESRGIGDELCRFFHLRFCDYGWWNFKKDDGSQGGQNFEGRVIIPVYDLDGALATFQGRDVTGAKEADKKYLFPKGLPGTGRFLFNGQNAPRAKRVLMGEGAFDVMAQKKALDEDVSLRDVVPVGSFGKHLGFGAMDGNDQLGRFIKLRRFGLEEVTIMWDGEEKALIAAIVAAELLRKIGLRVRIALLPADKDPNEVDGETVREAFYKAELYTPKLAVKWRLRNPYRR